MSGNNVSHAKNRTRRRQMPNLQSKSLFVPELGRTVKIKITTRELRTIDKIGLVPFLRQNDMKLSDVT